MGRSDSAVVQGRHKFSNSHKKSHIQGLEVAMKPVQQVFLAFFFFASASAAGLTSTTTIARLAATLEATKANTTEPMRPQSTKPPRLPKQPTPTQSLQSSRSPLLTQPTLIHPMRSHPLHHKQQPTLLQLLRHPPNQPPLPQQQLLQCHALPPAPALHQLLPSLAGSSWWCSLRCW